METIIIGNDGREYKPGEIPGRSDWYPINAFTRQATASEET